MALDYGIKVTKPGQDVDTVADVDVMFSTKFSTLKVYREGTVQLTTDGSGNGSATVDHNLGFAPAFYVFRKGTAQYTFLDASSYVNSFVPEVNIESIWIPGSFEIYTSTSQLVITAASQTPSTTYAFKYYILVDLAGDFSGSDNVSHQHDYGFKVSKEGKDVHTAKEYELAYSSLYKSLQYYDESYKTQSLTLPNMYADPGETSVYSGTYVDINHGLGYPPFFLAYAVDFIDTGYNVLVPAAFGYDDVFSPASYEAVEGFADSTKVRLSWIRHSQSDSDGNIAFEFPAQTITIKCIIFTENLLT